MRESYNKEFRDYPLDGMKCLLIILWDVKARLKWYHIDNR